MQPLRSSTSCKQPLVHELLLVIDARYRALSSGEVAMQTYGSCSDMPGKKPVQQITLRTLRDLMQNEECKQCEGLLEQRGKTAPQESLHLPLRIELPRAKTLHNC